MTTDFIDDCPGGKSSPTAVPSGSLAREIREKSPARILQIFSRYRNYGGEEGSVYRIGDLLQKGYDIGYFIFTGMELRSESLIDRGIGVAKAIHNWSVVEDLEKYQKLGNYEYWLIHNVFPAMSPSVYPLAAKLGVKVIQYLHNYRMGCVNGFFLNHGSPCQRCSTGNFWPAFQTACWHGSRIQSGAMGAIMAYARNRGLLESPEHYVALSEAQKKEHILMGIPAEKITVIPHFLHPASEPSPYPERGDVLFLGRLSPEKGVDRLLRAWKHVEHRGRNLLIGGDGPDRGRLEKLSLELGLRNVRFTGFLDKAQQLELWAGAACSVVPSVWKEPFGMVVLEAWSEARPVIGHRIGGIPEIIREGEDGLIVPPDHPGAMADAILEILDQPEQARMMGLSGWKRLHQDFSPEVWLEKIRTVIH